MSSYLPAKDTNEAKLLIEAYPTASQEKIREWAKLYGYARYKNFEDAVFTQYEVRRNKQPPVIESEPQTIYEPYPEFKLRPYPQPKTNRDEEDLAIVVSDWHLGKITSSYNLTIANKRIDKLLESVMKIVSLHRPIRKIWIFDAGDNVQGENPHQGSKLGETAVGAYEQIHEYAIPLMSRFLTSLAQGVSAVELAGVNGNHGVYDRIAPAKTNWDAFFYKSLKDSLINQKTIAIDIPLWFYQLVNIKGFRFFLIHGNQVKATQGIPLFALRRKMNEWHNYVGGFNYSYLGHFHTPAQDQVNTSSDYTICPPLVTGDEWAIEVVGRASQPKQLCFGIYSKYGRTFRYDLICDEAFLPKKYDDKEGVVTI